MVGQFIYLSPTVHLRTKIGKNVCNSELVAGVARLGHSCLIIHRVVYRGDSWMVAANVDAIPYANSTIPGVHAPHGSTPNAMDCGTACKINQTCSVWTWSSETEHCWFAFDGASNTSAFLCCCCRQDHCIQLDGLCSKANALNGAGKWQPMNLAGRTSGCDPSRVHGCVTPPPAGPPPPWNGAGATTVPVTGQ